MWGSINPGASVWGQGELWEERGQERWQTPGRREASPGSLARLPHFCFWPPGTHLSLHLYYHYAHFTEGNCSTARVWTLGNADTVSNHPMSPDSLSLSFPCPPELVTIWTWDPQNSWGAAATSLSMDRMPPGSVKAIWTVRHTSVPSPRPPTATKTRMTLLPWKSFFRANQSLCLHCSSWGLFGTEKH